MPDEETGGGGGKGNFLTRKVGPIPMWGWLAAGAVGVAVFLYRRKAAAASSSASTFPATDTSGVTSSPDVFGASGYSGGQQVGGYDSSSGDSFLQQLQGELGTIQSGVALSPQGVSQVQGVVSTTAPPVAVPVGPGQAPVQAANPIAAAIEAQYQQEAGRASDPGGLAYWENEYITKGPTVEAQEFSQTVASQKKNLGHA